MRGTLAALAAAILIAALPGSAAAGVDEQALIVDISRTTIGAPFRLGAEGPNRFDCSGLVWYVYNTAGMADRIGGKRVRARDLQRLFRDRGLLDARDPRVGDLAFYASPAKHVGIVTGFNRRGKALVTSALTSGVREHRFNWLDIKFHSYGHVGLSVRPDPTPSPTPEPTPEPTPTPTPSETPTPTPEPTPTPPPTDEAPASN